MSDSIVRKYTGISDTGMLQGVQTMKDLLGLHIDDFNAKGYLFAGAFLVSFQSAIDSAVEYPTDDEVMNQVGLLTTAMEDKWKTCRTEFQAGKTFVSQFAPGNKGILKEFGGDNYREMSKIEDKVYSFMGVYHKACIKYHIQLIAKGYLQARIDAIPGMATAFSESLIAQKVALKERLPQTQTRINFNNAAYDIAVIVSVASKQVYANNPALYQAFLLPGASNEPDSSFILRGKVMDMITGLDMPSVATTLPDRGMGSISDGNAKYGYPMNLDAGAAHLHAEFTGYQVYDEDLTLVEGETMMHNIMMKPL